MKLAKNSLYSFAGAGVPLAVSLVTVPLYVSEIGMERYGALAISWLLLGYFGQADFGIGRAITQRIASHHSAPRAWMANAVASAFASILLFSSIGGLLVFFAGHFFFSGPFKISESLRPELVAAVWVLAMSNPVVASSGVASGALVGLERFGLVAIGNMVGNVMMQVGPLFCAIYFDDNLQLLIIFALCGRAFGLLVLLGGVWQVFIKGQSIRPAWSEIRELASFGAWIMVTALIGPLMIFADRFAIGTIESAAAVAVYSIPFQIASRTMVFPIAIVHALFPRFAAESENASRQRCEDFTIFIGQIFAPVVLALVLLTGPLLTLWLGAQLDERSIIIGQILFASVWINAVANVPYAFIQAKGDPRFTALLHILELPFYIALLYYLGTKFGLPGFAVAFGLRCFFDFMGLAVKSGADLRRIILALFPQIALISIAGFIALTAGNDLVLLFTAVFLVVSSIGTSLIQMPELIRLRFSQLPIVGRFISIGERA